MTKIIFLIIFKNKIQLDDLVNLEKQMKRTLHSKCQMVVGFQ